MASISSQTVRERAIAAYESGQGSQQDVAAMFGIHLRTFQRWLERARQDGEFAPRPRGHRRPAFEGLLLQELDGLVSSEPDITLEQIADHFTGRVSCSLQAIHNALSRLEWRFKKKSLRASEQDRPDVKARRETWTKKYLRWFRKFLHRLVFLDESGAKTNMVRLYGRARGGQRCVDDAPHGHWNTTTLVSSIRLDGTTACMSLDGAMTSEAYRQYVRQILVPTLQTGDIVIFDNLGAHHDQQALDLIHAAGAMTLPLPAYSPDFNPIEKMWSKVKALLRKAKARTVEALDRAIRDILKAITPSDAEGWFASCGYAAPQS